MEIPKRMMVSTLTIFLLLPLTIFYWKETHLEQASSSSSSSSSSSTKKEMAAGREVYPNWFADNSSGEGDTAELPSWENDNNNNNTGIDIDIDDLQKQNNTNE